MNRRLGVTDSSLPLRMTGEGAQNDRRTLRMTGGRHVRRQYPIHSLSGIFPAHISREQEDVREDRMMKKDTDVGIIL